MRTRTWLLVLCMAIGLFASFPTSILAQEKITPVPTMTLEELAVFDGKDGRKAYYAFEGVVYDVTNSTLWKLGDHFGHKAGKDLSNALEGAPHGDAIVKQMPVVAMLVQTTPPTSDAPATVAPATQPAPSVPSSTERAWYEGRIRFLGLSILGWTGILLGVFFVLNFATCFALPWSKISLPWKGARPGPDPLDKSPAHQHWAAIHKYFAWITVALGIVHGIIGFLQMMFSMYL